MIFREIFFGNSYVVRSFLGHENVAISKVTFLVLGSLVKDIIQYERILSSSFSCWHMKLVVFFPGQHRMPKCFNAGPAFNPYHYLGCQEETCWPRGYPLEQVPTESECLKEDWWETSSPNKTTRFGVLQSLADVQPDVDAIFRYGFFTVVFSW